MEGYASRLPPRAARGRLDHLAGRRWRLRTSPLPRSLLPVAAEIRPPPTTSSTGTGPQPVSNVLLLVFFPPPPRRSDLAGGCQSVKRTILLTFYWLLWLDLHSFHLDVVHVLVQIGLSTNYWDCCAQSCWTVLVQLALKEEDRSIFLSAQRISSPSLWIQNSCCCNVIDLQIWDAKIGYLLWGKVIQTWNLKHTLTYTISLPKAAGQK
jgi:hypothetical protein